MSLKKRSTLAWVLIALVLIYALSQTGLIKLPNPLSTVEIGGHPALNVTAEKLSDDTEVYPGKTYELSGNTHFTVPLTVDGAGQWMAGIWKAIQDHYGVIPFYWKLEYNYVITKDGYPEGEWEWWCSVICQFTPVKSESITLVLIMLLTTWQFWLGVGMTASLIILAISFALFILKPIAEGSPWALIAFVAVLVAVVLILISSGGKRRKR